MFSLKTKGYLAEFTQFAIIVSTLTTAWWVFFGSPEPVNTHSFLTICALGVGTVGCSILLLGIFCEVLEGQVTPDRANPVNWSDLWFPHRIKLFQVYNSDTDQYVIMVKYLWFGDVVEIPSSVTKDKQKSDKQFQLWKAKRDQHCWFYRSSTPDNISSNVVIDKG